MASAGAFISRCNALENQQVTVPTNPYGGQCVAYIDALTQEFTDKNFAYVNAIDCLYRAAANGFEVEFFTGHNMPREADIFVSEAYNHPFGHIGVVLSVSGRTVITSEQNVDLNADALTNGGWVRRKARTIYTDGTFTYNDGILPAQGLIGWFRLPFSEPVKKNENKNEVEEMDFIVKSKKYGYGVMTQGKYMGVSEMKTVDAFKQKGFPEMEVGESDHKRFVDTYK